MTNNNNKWRDIEAFIIARTTLLIPNNGESFQLNDGDISTMNKKKLNNHGKKLTSLYTTLLLVAMTIISIGFIVLFWSVYQQHIFVDNGE